MGFLALLSHVFQRKCLKMIAVFSEESCPLRHGGTVGAQAVGPIDDD